MNDMELRELKLEEHLAYRKLACIAFHSKSTRMDDEETYLESVKKDHLRAQESPTALNNCNTKLGLFREGKLLSALTVNAFEIHFDGNVCDMCGIGGVMSDPSVRKTGGVSRLMAHTLAIAREKGQIFSHLSPFRTSFYRKFGYEHCAFGNLWHIPTQFLPDTPCTGMEWYENTQEQRETLKALYEAFAVGYNLALRRSNYRWKGRFGDLPPYTGSRFSYLHHGDQGTDGFLSYTVHTPTDAPMEITVEELIFTEPEALRQMLSFLGSQQAYASQVHLPLPAEVDITFWLKEFCTAYDKINVRRELAHLGATRVVDVEQVLRLARYQGAGTADLKILDPTCPWNNKCFHVDFDGHCLSVLETDRWDIQMDIGSFTALILGGFDLSQAPYLPAVTIRGNVEALRKIFYKKLLWIGDSF